MNHLPVLLKQVLELLAIEEGDTYFDATLGTGGHAEEVWKSYGKKVKISGVDADSSAVDIAKARLEMQGAEPKFIAYNFRNIDKAIEILDIEKPNRILFDLGWNKLQFESPEGDVGRGFSFQKEEPLQMTFRREQSEDGFTAETIVNSWDEENIKTIIEAYGEERFARRIAKQIVEARSEGPIRTSMQLAEIVKKATPLWYHFKKIHPATKTFQALRITVNDELRALQEGLEKAFEALEARGRIAVISFHSLEDRIVKQFFKKLQEEGKAEILTKKPIIADEREVTENPRARSAKLRAVQKSES
jgi:16S rRNA (cytosine1402-N4)-methyltransferase